MDRRKCSFIHLKNRRYSKALFVFIMHALLVMSHGLNYHFITNTLAQRVKVNFTLKSYLISLVYLFFFFFYCLQWFIQTTDQNASASCQDIQNSIFYCINKTFHTLHYNLIAEKAFPYFLYFKTKRLATYVTQNSWIAFVINLLKIGFKRNSGK